MLLHIRHETVYRYDPPAHHSVQVLRLVPRRERRQRTLAWQLRAPGRRSEQVDAHGNLAHLLSIDEPHAEIRLLVEGTVDVLEASPLLAERGPIPPLAYRAATPLTAADEAVRALAAHVPPAPAAGEALLGLAAAVCAAVRYRPGATTTADTAITALARGEGVCQDQTHAFIAACRAAGLPARYVSGYLHAGEAREIASHAWADVWLEAPGAWYGIDVTHAQPVGAHHCRLAVGRDYLDAAPVRGVRRGGGHETLEVGVLVSAEPPQQ